MGITGWIVTIAIVIGVYFLMGHRARVPSEHASAHETDGHDNSDHGQPMGGGCCGGHGR